MEVIFFLLFLSEVSRELKGEGDFVKSRKLTLPAYLQPRSLGQMEARKAHCALDRFYLDHAFIRSF
jgi:hypothetical protein